MQRRERKNRPERRLRAESVGPLFVFGSVLRTNEDSLFLRQNDYWMIRYHGQSAILKASRGMDCLAVLLRNSGREFHVRELLARPPEASTSAVAAIHGHVMGELYAGVPVFDSQTKAECKCRLTELRQVLSEAEQFNDPQRKTEAQNEIKAITNYLASAVGLGGRERRASLDAERARSAVTKCIKTAVKKIRNAIPSLGCHLEARIRTGYFCSYNPHPDRPVTWKF